MNLSGLAHKKRTSCNFMLESQPSLGVSHHLGTYQLCLPPQENLNPTEKSVTKLQGGTGEKRSFFHSWYFSKRKVLSS